MFGVSNLLLVSSIGALSFTYFILRLIENRRFYSKLVRARALPPESNLLLRKYFFTD
jgi:hypothetical protein